LSPCSSSNRRMTTTTGCSKVSTLATHLAEGLQQHLAWGRTPVI
jgi:hypothetical protein